MAVSLGLLAHTLGGGARPAALTLVTATVLLGCASTLATGRRLGRLATASGLVLSQLGLHTWFSLSEFSPSGFSPSGFSPSGGHGCDVGGLVLSHHHTQVLHCAHSGTAFAWWPAMPVAHLLAVLVTALLLAHGEALLWRLADLAGARLVRLVRSAVVGDHSRVVALVWTAAASSGRLLLEPMRGRGPPVAVRAG